MRRFTGDPVRWRNSSYLVFVAIYVLFHLYVVFDTFPDDPGGLDDFAVHFYSSKYFMNVRYANDFVQRHMDDILSECEGRINCIRRLEVRFGTPTNYITTNIFIAAVEQVLLGNRPVCERATIATKYALLFNHLLCLGLLVWLFIRYERIRYLAPLLMGVSLLYLVLTFVDRYVIMLPISIRIRYTVEVFVCMPRGPAGIVYFLFAIATIHRLPLRTVMLLAFVMSVMHTASSGILLMIHVPILLFMWFDRQTRRKGVPIYQEDRAGYLPTCLMICLLFLFANLLPTYLVSLSAYDSARVGTLSLILRSLDVYWFIIALILLAMFYLIGKRQIVRSRMNADSSKEVIVQKEQFWSIFLPYGVYLIVCMELLANLVHAFVSSYHPDIGGLLQRLVGRIGGNVRLMVFLIFSMVCSGMVMWLIERVPLIRRRRWSHIGNTSALGIGVFVLLFAGGRMLFDAVATGDERWSGFARVDMCSSNGECPERCDEARLTDIRDEVCFYLNLAACIEEQ